LFFIGTDIWSTCSAPGADRPLEEDAISVSPRAPFDCTNKKGNKMAAFVAAEEDINKEKGDLTKLCVPDPPESLGKQSIGNPAAAQPGMISHLVRSLRPGQDLTRVLIPVEYLEPRSLLEKMTDHLMHPTLFVEYVFLRIFLCLLFIRINQSDDPEERMVRVLKWFVSGFHYETMVCHCFLAWKCLNLV
jgi:hypothetical protein